MKSLLFCCFLFTLVSCQNKYEDLLKSITETTTAMQAEEFPSQPNMEKIIGLYDEFITNYPDDEFTLTFMELKAKYQAANQQFEAAIATYDQLIASYPNANETPDAYFMQAFIYENQLMDKAAAEAKYKKFLVLYPNHPLANDAQFSLNSLYLTEEQLLQKIMDLQKAQVAE